MNQVVEILGIPFSKIILNETTDLLENRIQKEQPKLFHLITINPEITITSQSDIEFQEIIKEADLITPNGIGSVLASWRRKEPIPERVTGFDLLHQLLQKGNKHGWRFYFLGSTYKLTKKPSMKLRIFTLIFQSLEDITDFLQRKKSHSLLIL